MKKRGQLTLKANIELVIAITIFLLFIYVGKSWGNGEVFQKAKTAKESSLIIDAMYATRGNAYITHPVNFSDFNLKFFPDNVIVSSTKRKPDETAYSYYLLPALDFKLEKEINKPNKLVFAKLRGEILILDEEPNLNLVQYREINTKDTISDKNVLLDINQPTIDDPTKLVQAKRIIEVLKTQFNNPYVTEKTKDAGIGGSLPLDVDMMISISIGDFSDERNVIKAYYPIGGEEKKKRKLASILVNQFLIRDLNLNGGNAIPTDQFTDYDTEIAVQIQIGNINSKKSLDMLNKKTTEIVTAIYNATKEYYYS